MEYYFDINWEADKFYKVACFIILYSETKHSKLTYFRDSDSGMAALFFISRPSSSPLSEGATPMVTMTFVKGSF